MNMSGERARERQEQHDPAHKEPVTDAAGAELLARRQRAVPRGPFNVHPIFAARAEGARLWDVAGREYLDFCGGIGVQNVGHNHPRVVAAVSEQAGRFLHTCWHVAMYEPYLELAERLAALVPTGGENQTALFNSGAEAVENAIKICRAHARRTGVVAFRRGFHGRTLLGMTLTGKVHPYTAGFGPFAPEVYHLPHGPFYAPADDRDEAQVAAGAAAALADLFHYEVEPESVACLILEPVLGEGGFFPVHPAALRVVSETCREHGILLVCDEIQSGCGRCGAFLACERYGLEPDLVLLAKSLGGGLPLSAVVGRAEIMSSPPVGGLGGTYGGNPVACAAALAVLDVLEEEGLYARAEAIGEQVQRTFARLADEHAHVARPRGLSAMCALEVVDPVSGMPDPARTGRIIAHCREQGLLVMSASGNVLRTLMPLVISDADLQAGLRILADAVAAAGEESV
jgi:4-aminobutyrate aminotransferase/(S)-3-amino-2-methylpropionate transaminase